MVLFKDKLSEIKDFNGAFFNQKIFYITEFLGNLFLFFPFPFVVYAFSKRRLSSGKIFILMFCSILFIETTQFVFRVGMFDIDDIFLNNTGGVFGIYIFNIIYKKINK